MSMGAREGKTFRDWCLRQTSQQNRAKRHNAIDVCEDIMVDYMHENLQRNAYADPDGTLICPIGCLRP